MVTSGRLRHGIVLALVGLLAGLGIVLGLYGSGGLSRVEQAAQGKLSALSPDAPLPGKDADKPAQETLRQDSPRQETPPQDKPAEAKPNPGSGSPPAAGAEPGKAAEAAVAPSFDIVRVEPNGDAVVAGRGRPNTVIEMLVDGKPVAKALTDPNGQFAIVPPALPKGSSEIVLRSRTADGQEVRSPQSVAVSVAPEGKSRPLVALSTPDAPTVVLSQPGTPETAQAGRVDKPAGGGGTTPTGRPAQDATTRIVSVDAEPGGRLFVTGTGKPGTDVRLYLNDTLIAPARIGPDGRVTFTIGRGVAQGQYQVRIDEIDPKSGRVLHRAEVPFAMPQQVAEAARADHGQMDPGKGDHAKPEQKPVSALRGERMAATPSSSPPSRSLPAPRSAANGLAEAQEDPAASGAVFVPAIATARITRGDNLWQISKRIYGRGERYTVIYDANQGQIRDPDLIYPGQIFVLPDDRRG